MTFSFFAAARAGLVTVRALGLAGAALPVIAAAQQSAPSATTGSAVQSTGVDDAERQAPLPDGSPGEDIVVTGARAARERAIERKRALPTIADVVAADDIGKLPDFNTAEALQRLPGVSVQIDQGEPRYVVVRGIDPNLNQVTVDGNLVGIPEAEGRRVALDTIPSDLVSAIEVVKAVTPDYDGNAIGGSINLVTPTAFDRPDPFLFATARGNYNDKSGKVAGGGSATAGRRFGLGDQFGVVVAGSYLKRFIDSDLAEPTNWTTIAGVATPTNYTLFDYRIMRERIGAIANLDWRPADGTRVYLRTIYNEFTDEEERDQFNFAFAAGTPTRPTPTSIRFPNGRATRQFRQNNQTQKLYNISPGAEFVLGRAEIDLNYTFAHAQEHTPVRDDLEFRSTAGQASVLELGASRPLFSFIDPRLFDPAAFPLRRIRLRREEIDEDLHTFRADLKVLFDDQRSFLKVGGKYISREKTRDNTQTQLVAVREGNSSLAASGGALPEIDDFYNGDYRFGPAIDYRQVLHYYEENAGLVRLDAAQTAINERSVDYDIREDIYAAYTMASVSLGDFTAIGGVRVEITDGRYDAFSIRQATGITPLTFNQDYTHVLPSVHLNWRARPDVLLRAAWTNTLGRPNYDATVPTFQEDAGIGSAGNPDLESYESMGLDFSAEYYPDTDSIFSLGVFYKKLENPVFTRTIQNTSFAGVPLLRLSQPQNADEGELFGVEANLQRRLTFLPAPLDGFGVSVNGTYVTSDVTVPGREDEDIPFFRQSDWIANASIFYERNGFEARFAVNFRDDFIEFVGTSTASDIYQKARTTMDARISYEFSPGLVVFGSLSNLNEAPLTFYQTTKDQTFAREIYSFNGDFGISIRF